MHRLLRTTAIIVIAASFILIPPTRSRAETIAELQSKINERNRQIQQIEAEITKYKDQLLEVGSEKKTLQNAIAELELTRKKLLTDIRLTEQKIDTAELSIEQITLQIDDKERVIQAHDNALGETLRRINESDGQTLVEALLAYKNLSAFWSEVDTIGQFQSSLKADLAELRGLKTELETHRGELETTRQSLTNFRNELSGQKQVVDQNKKEKDTLLTVTKNKESEYQRLLREKEEQKEAFEREVRAFESALQIAIDPNALPKSGSGVLAPPLPDVSYLSCWDGGGDHKNCLTQTFGNTPFASANPQVYNGKGHNGVDFRATTGTPVHAALSGIVEGTGNTDVQSGCYSYGKWILIKHANGLATLYAHLSTINVSKGQAVATGDTVGLSGNTGYSTGPHLHFTVYASQGVRIQQFSNSVNCKNVSIPIAPLDAYLNPLSYL